MVAKWNLADEGLGQQVPSKWDCAPLDAGDNCVFYFLGANPGQIQCGLCKPGFSFDFIRKICIKSNIANCAQSVFDSNVEKCAACQNSTYPSQDLSSCLPYPSPVSGKFANCVLMGLDQNMKPSCTNCSQGFTVYNGYCVSTPTEIDGCMAFDKDGNNCLICKVMDGWFSMTKDSQKCTKA